MIVFQKKVWNDNYSTPSVHWGCFITDDLNICFVFTRVDKQTVRDLRIIFNPLSDWYTVMRLHDRRILLMLFSFQQINRDSFEFFRSYISIWFVFIAIKRNCRKVVLSLVSVNQAVCSWRPCWLLPVNPKVNRRSFGPVSLSRYG